MPGPSAPYPVKQPTPARPADAVGTAGEHLKTLRTGDTIGEILRRSLPLDRPISSITRADVRKVLDRHMRQGHGYAANRAHSTMAAFFVWAVDRELVAVSPMAGMNRPMRREESRDRVLDDNELAVVWKAVDTLTVPRRDAIRLLMLTGLRRSEASEIEWADIAGDMLTIPAARSKNRVAFSVPLSPQAIAVVNARGRTSDRVFDFDGRRPDLSTYFARLVKTLPIPNVRIHDLRRSFASGLQRLGTRPEVIDRCLAHSAVIKGVAAVYMRDQYLPERRAAMDLWGQHVEKMISA
jgi:integrase